MKLGLSLRSVRYFLHRLLGRKTTHLDGMILLCDPDRVNRSLAREIIKGRYELAERTLAKSAIRNGDRVLEVGTGLGVVGVLCSRLAGAGNVTCYEANPALEDAIRENFALNGLTPKIVIKAVTVDGNPITFFQNTNVVSSSIFDRGLPTQKITVPSDSINAAISQSLANIIVMDVEGGEIDLLGAADLALVREIIVEVHPHIVGVPAIEIMIEGLIRSGFSVKERLHKTVWLSRVG